MMRRRPSVDLAMYEQAVPLLVRHPSIFVMPLLAAVVELLFTQLAYLFTNAVGGAGAGIFQLLIQLVYLWAFGVTIIQASNIWRKRRGTFLSIRGRRCRPSALSGAAVTIGRLLS